MCFVSVAGLARASAEDDFLAPWVACVADESDGELLFKFPLSGVRSLARFAKSTTWSLMEPAETKTSETSW